MGDRHPISNARARRAISEGRAPGMLRKDNRGMAAIEFAMIASFLALSLLNVSDLAIFLFDKLEVENATQMGAQAAWATCTSSTSLLPATVNCAGLNGAITTAIQSTPLGTAPKLASGYPSEAYYCVNNSGALTSVGAVSATKPSDCSSAGSSTTKPGDYLLVSTTYTFSPLFSGITLAALLPATITNTAWVRLS